MRCFLALVPAALFIAGCGDPAPGEGVDKPHEQGPMPKVVSAREAVSTPDIPSIDLQTMEKAEYEKIISDAPGCSFSYSPVARPVLASSINEGGVTGVVKIHGKLVKLRAQQVKSFDALAQGATFTADGLQVRVIPDPEKSFERRDGKMQREADAIFELEQGLKVGYGGWYACEKSQRSNHQE